MQLLPWELPGPFLHVGHSEKMVVHKPGSRLPPDQVLVGIYWHLDFEIASSQNYEK